jgi:hypothetical protein
MSETKDKIKWDSEIDPAFKSGLADFIEYIIHGCDSFVNGVNRCTTYNELRRFLIDNDDVADALMLESKETIDDLEEQVEDLESDVRDLRYRLNQKRGDFVFHTNTMWDEEKFKTFVEFQDKYTPIEFEKLLENGNK